MEAKLKQVVFLFFVLFSTPGVKAQQQYMVFHYNQKNGLPQSSVNDLFWDRTGFLWVSTEAGLVRFDGMRFQTFNMSNTPGITNDRFRWILPDGKQRMLTSAVDGRVFAIAGNQVTPFMQCKRYFALNGILPDSLTLFALQEQAPKGALRKNWKQYPTELMAWQNNLWVLGMKYIYLVKQNRTTDSISFTSGRGSALFAMQDNLYAFDGARFFYVDTLRKQLVAAGSLPAQVTGNAQVFYQSGLQKIFVAAEKVIYELVADAPQHIRAQVKLDATHLVEGEITRVNESPWDKMFAIGTLNNGLYLVKPKLFQTWRHRDPERGSGYYAQVALSDTSVLSSNGMVLYQGGSSVSGFDLSHVNPQTLYLDRDRVLWSCRTDSVFYQEEGRKRKALILRESGSSIISLVPYGDSLVAVTPQCIAIIYKRNVIRRYDLPPESRSNWVGAFAGEDGLLLSDHQAVHHFSFDSGLLTKQFAYPEVRYLLKHGALLYGASYGGGVFIRTGDRVVSIPSDRQGYLNKAHSLVITDSNLIISTNNGIFTTTLEALNRYVSGASKQVYYQYFNDEEGIGHTEFNGGCNPSNVKLNNGSISFSGMGGLVVFKPESLRIKSQNIKRLYLGVVNEDSVAQVPSDTLIIQPGTEKTGLTFSFIYWHNPYNVQLQYKLDGFNKGWNNMPPPGEKLWFTNLPAGNYTLYVRSQTGFSEADIQVAAYTLIKLPRYYETWGFRVIIFMLAVSGIAFAVYAYNARLRQKNELLERYVQKRTNDIRLANESLQKSERELRQSVNVKNKLISIMSHDIITPLKFISLVSRNYSGQVPEQGNEVLREIHHTSERLHNNAQNILNWVRYQNNLIRPRPENTSPFALAENLCSLFHDLSAMNQCRLINNIDMDDIIRTDKNILTIMMQNILSNAIKYNHDCDVTITSRQLPGQYEITIADTGSGISANNLRRIRAIKEKVAVNMFDDSTQGTGLGYVIIYELAALVLAEIRVNSEADMGTAISIILPEHAPGQG